MSYPLRVTRNRAVHRTEHGVVVTGGPDVLDIRSGRLGVDVPRLLEVVENTPLGQVARTLEIAQADLDRVLKALLAVGVLETSPAEMTDEEVALRSSSAEILGAGPRQRQLVEMIRELGIGTVSSGSGADPHQLEVIVQPVPPATTAHRVVVQRLDGLPDVWKALQEEAALCVVVEQVRRIAVGGGGAQVDGSGTAIALDLHVRPAVQPALPPESPAAVLASWDVPFDRHRKHPLRPIRRTTSLGTVHHLRPAGVAWQPATVEAEPTRAAVRRAAGSAGSRYAAPSIGGAHGIHVFLRAQADDGVHWGYLDRSAGTVGPVLVQSLTAEDDQALGAATMTVVFAANRAKARSDQGLRGDVVVQLDTAFLIAQLELEAARVGMVAEARSAPDLSPQALAALGMKPERDVVTAAMTLVRRGSGSTGGPWRRVPDLSYGCAGELDQQALHGVISRAGADGRTVVYPRRVRGVPAAPAGPIEDALRSRGLSPAAVVFCGADQPVAQPGTSAERVAAAFVLDHGRSAWRLARTAMENGLAAGLMVTLPAGLASALDPVHRRFVSFVAVILGEPSGQPSFTAGGSVVRW